MVKFEKVSDESVESYLIRLADIKETDKSVTWQDIADNVYYQFGIRRSESWVRKTVREILALSQTENLLGVLNETRLQYENTTLEMRKERAKLTERRNQINAQVRAISREETIKEIAHEVAVSMKETKFLKSYEKIDLEAESEAILCISDWHYGLEFKNPWNEFSPEICKTRINKLKTKTVEYLKRHKCNVLHLVNLQDLIAGRIHLGIRLDSQYDVITQTLHVSEMLAEFISDLSKYVNIQYYDCLDNHSRLEPNKKDAQDIESLTRVIPWYLKERLKDNKRIHINENTFGYDLITFESMGHSIIGCHGDKDTPQKALSQLNNFTQCPHDMILMAHRHHTSIDEQNNTLCVCNGSLMGTDTYAHNLRLTSRPSQNLLIVTKENVMDTFYRITL